MKKKVSISVIIPVYNVEKYLDKCLQSIINQTYNNIEIIIINDGSTDGSLEICKKYKDKDDRIILFNQDNKGTSAAKNVGIRISSGEWLSFIDSDDFLEENAFEQLLKINKNFDIIQFGIRSIENGMIIRERKPSRRIEIHGVSSFLKKMELRTISACLHLIKSELVKQNEIYFDEDLRTGEDILFMYKLISKATNFLILDTIYYNQVLSENSLIRSPLSLFRIENKYIVLNRLIDFIRENNQIDIFKKEINNILKPLFIGLLNYNGYSNDYKRIQKNYQVFFVRNKDVLNSIYCKIANINIDYVIKLLKLKRYWKR
jgi:glycosyltransferase involved in cell wall biosynthesis